VWNRNSPRHRPKHFSLMRMSRPTQCNLYREFVMFDAYYYSVHAVIRVRDVILRPLLKQCFSVLKFAGSAGKVDGASRGELSMNPVMLGEDQSRARPQLWSFSRQLWRAIALVLLGSALITAPPVAARNAPRHHTVAQPAAARDVAGGTHVYCIRGFINIFSLGMDELCGQLSRMGLNTSVYNHLAWGTIADEAAADYKAGRVRNIILVGHSLGASAVADITSYLGGLGVPVRLAVELDATFGTTASGEVDQFVNYYISTGAGRPAARGSQFRGTLLNIDVSKDPGIGHLNIDKNPGLQAQIIGQVRRIVARSPAPRSERAAARANPGDAAQASTKTANHL
jgi:hypothetical protein